MHGGVPLVAAESNLRPASSSEIFTKRILELRPSRKRLREVLEERPELEEPTPFSDDYQLQQWGEGDDDSQMRFVEMPGAGGGIPETPFPEQPAQLESMEFEAIPEPELPLPFPAEVEDVIPTPTSPLADQEPTPVLDLASDVDTVVVSEEPELEEMPSTPAITPLQQALRNSPDQLDGIPRSAQPPGLARPRSRSPLREARNIPVPDEPAEGHSAIERVKQQNFGCFLAK
jgi:hypothetical protein